MSLANPSRRGFLKAGGLLLVTVNLPAPLLALAEQGATDLPLDQVDSFIAIAADGKVTAFCGHVDLGTGIRTALAQIVAEELDVAFEQVEMILGDTRRTPDQGRPSPAPASRSAPCRCARPPPKPGASSCARPEAISRCIRTACAAKRPGLRRRQSAATDRLRRVAARPALQPEHRRQGAA